MNKARSTIIFEIEQKFDFLNDIGTRNTIFMFRMITGSAIQMQKYVYLCCINYANWFNILARKEMFERLSNV